MPARCQHFEGDQSLWFLWKFELRRQKPPLLGDMPYNGISPIEVCTNLILFLIIIIIIISPFCMNFGTGDISRTGINNHVQIFTVSMSSIGIALIASFYVITQP